MIKIERKNSYSDKLRSYKIFIDDIYRGDIKKNEIKDFEVENGSHIVYAKIDWCRSNKLKLNIDNNIINLEVGSSLNGWKLIFALLYITFLKNQYL